MLADDVTPVKNSKSNIEDTILTDNTSDTLHIDTTLAYAAKNAEKIERSENHNSLKNLLQGQDNPFAGTCKIAA